MSQSINKQQEVLGNQQKTTYIVDSENGPYKSIQEAIDASEINSVIKVAPGIYCENVQIRKSGLSIEPRDKEGDIILVANSKPAFFIHLLNHESCSLAGFKITHAGINEQAEQLEKFMADNQHLAAFAGNSNTGPENELVNKMQIDNQMNSIIFLQGGKLFLNDSLLSLSFIQKSNKAQLIPAIICIHGSELNMQKCEIKGNKYHETVGVVIKYAHAFIKNCKIYNNQMGGIHIWTTKRHNVKISKSKIQFNGRIGIIKKQNLKGIHCVGENGNVIIENNYIESNEGSAVKIGIANQSQVINNEIRLNKTGIFVSSAEPQILNNLIEKNYNNGIYTEVYDNLRCDALIKNNQILNNKENGICCVGKNNFTKIENNSMIGYNKKAGIKGEHHAQIIILKNTISKNLGQGILLVETSSAHIEKNKINSNIKANIAFGGFESVETVIIDNEINKGRSEGIYIIEGGHGWIFRNTIKENNDGIIMITSVPFVNKNLIEQNRSNGVMIMKDSRPKITDNKILDNDGIGLYIKDVSTGIIKDNLIRNNELELVVERMKIELENIASEDNIVVGDSRIPQIYLECLIF